VSTNHTRKIWTEDFYLEGKTEKKECKWSSAEICIEASQLASMTNEQIAEKLDIPVVYATSFTD
jgi:hypothetical protein